MGFAFAETLVYYCVGAEIGVLINSGLIFFTTLKKAGMGMLTV